MDFGRHKTGEIRLMFEQVEQKFSLYLTCQKIESKKIKEFKVEIFGIVY